MKQRSADKVQVQYRKGKRPKHGQALLLNLLWRKLGGPSVVSNALNVPWYQPGNWNRDGQVPIKYLSMVATKFKLPVWGLNYKAAKLIKFADKIPSWEKVAGMYGFSSEDVRRIIKLGEPR